jgi:hypothetical protein
MLRDGSGFDVTAAIYLELNDAYEFLRSESELFLEDDFLLLSIFLV